MRGRRVRRRHHRSLLLVYQMRKWIWPEAVAIQLWNLRKFAAILSPRPRWCPGVVRAPVPAAERAMEQSGNTGPVTGQDLTPADQVEVRRGVGARRPQVLATSVPGMLDSKLVEWGRTARRGATRCAGSF